MTKTSIKWVALAFGVFLILVVIAANLGLGPMLFGFLRYIPGGDKTGHFVLMGTLSFLLNSVFSANKTRFGKVEVLKGTIIAAILVTVEEFTQIFLVNRGFSLIDLAADFAGMFVGGRIALWLVNRQARKQIA